jgi:uncharacterized protein
MIFVPTIVESACVRHSRKVTKAGKETGEAPGCADTRAFQVFAKPAGSRCNLGCDYCYYLEKERLYPKGEAHRMPDEVLEAYIEQQIRAWPGPEVFFSWHGGEPTLPGLDFFRKIVALQRKHTPLGRTVSNGIQTNGTLLDEEWCRFLSRERFWVGLSLDGPRELHDTCRVTRDRRPTFDAALRGYRLLKEHGVPVEILCVVHARNVQRPTEVYRFFRRLEAPYLTFLPLVERLSGSDSGVTERSVPPEAFGEFLCTIFDKWQQQDMGRVKVQIFEESTSPAFGREHTLCIFKETCGRVPVIEHNGDFYSCDHFVDPQHRLGNILTTPLLELLESPAQRAFGEAKRDSLPGWCRSCEVRAFCNGECPKNRFTLTPEGEPGLNYLCAGYKRFFNHCRPFIDEVGRLWRLQQASAGSEAAEGAHQRPMKTPGRNDPCPCGSGRKYKRCCLGK